MARQPCFRPGILIKLENLKNVIARFWRFGFVTPAVILCMIEGPKAGLNLLNALGFWLVPASVVIASLVSSEVN